MNVYKLFICTNHIKQVELAKFLGISEGSISNLVKGRNNLSEEHFAKLLSNDKGWDISMFQHDGIFVQSGDNSVVINGSNKVGNIDNRHYYSDSPDVLRAQIAILDERIKEKDAQIKEKDAQIKSLLEILAKSK